MQERRAQFSIQLQEVGMQEELDSTYRRFKAAVQLPDTLLSRLSPPLLLYVPRRWMESGQRILIVGQETLGWDFEAGDYYPWPYPPIRNFQDFLDIDKSVEAMIHGYRQFEFALHQPQNYGSPFWRAYRQIRVSVGDNADGFETSVLWTNLFRTSLDGGSVVGNGSPTEIELIRSSGADLLKAEIKILQPTSVIFFTGPNYNKHLYAQFPGYRLIDFCEHDVDRTSGFEHPALPSSWRTYHPGYLARGHWSIVDQIVSAVCNT